MKNNLTSAAQLPLHHALSPISAEWTLWSVGPDGTVLAQDGPGVLRMGHAPGELVGRSVEEAYAHNPRCVAYVRNAMQRPTTERLEVNGYVVLASGGPTPDGGCAGLSLVEGPAPSGGRGDDTPERVLELGRNIPQLGAMKGDLLVADPDDPEHVGLYRKIPCAALPRGVRDEVRRLTPRPCESERAHAPGTPAPRPERATHLRLLP